MENDLFVGNVAWKGVFVPMVLKISRIWRGYFEIYFIKKMTWLLLRFVPAILIFWHLHLLVTTDPGMFLIGWWPDLIWISLWATSLLSLTHPSPGGYLYLVLLFSVYIGLGCRISYLVIDE